MSIQTSNVVDLENLKIIVSKACWKLNPEFNCEDGKFIEDINETCKSIAKKILEHGSQIDDNVKWTVMGLHVKVNSYEYFEACDAALRLFYKLVDCSKVNASGVTVLHRVVVVDFIKGLKFLLERDINVNQKSIPLGLTPLHCARSPECVNLLLKHGADPNIKNANNETPLLLIYKGERMYNNAEENMIALLLKAGAEVVDTIEFFFSNEMDIFHRNSYIKYDNLRRLVFEAGAKAFKELADLGKKEPSRLTEGHPLYKYVKEIQLLSNEKILHVSLLDFLVKDKRVLSVYLRNSEVLQKLGQIMSNKKKLRQYPYYKRHLVRNFTAAKRRLQLEKKASIGLCSVLQKSKISVLHPDHLITEKIIYSLDMEDLENLIKL